MKVTSFDLSKKLAEIGFEADYDYCYDKVEEKFLWNKSFEITCWEGHDLDNYYPAFDLETILTALPENLAEDDELKLTHRMISYEYYSDGHALHYTVKEENESLVNMAARLLIILREKNLVKFNGVKDE